LENILNIIKRFNKEIRNKYQIFKIKIWWKYKDLNFKIFFKNWFKYKMNTNKNKFEVLNYYIYNKILLILNFNNIIIIKIK